ncbi:hypothetical protein MMC15_007577 [Xylographa vitiligo]|nr:hypothetical protein [Xylographa vitiligo]
MVPQSKIEDVPWSRMKAEIFQLHWTNTNRESMLARLIVGFMAVDIRFRLHNDIAPWQNSGLKVAQSVISISPPTLNQIPFAEFMANIPLPFEPAVERFNTCHLEKMATREFLEAGEWVGYYCTSQEGPFWYLNPPMQGIFFQVDDVCEGDVLRLRAGGFDGISRFKLRGTLHRSTGVIAMVTKYRGGKCSRWYGTLTPFGIAGSFGSYNAWFWMWKADWCR